MQNRITRSKKFWEETIKAWQESKEPAPAWCRAKDLSYHTFYKWKTRLTKTPMTKKSFLELCDEKSSTLSIEYHGVQIHLDKNFDPRILKKCLEALKSFAC